MIKTVTSSRRMHKSSKKDRSPHGSGERAKDVPGAPPPPKNREAWDSGKEHVAKQGSNRIKVIQLHDNRASRE